MQKHKKLRVRILSLTLSAAMVCTTLLTTVFAAAADMPIGASSVTECHPAHDEGCGYTVATTMGGCTHEHNEDCGYTEGEDGSPCTYVPDEDAVASDSNAAEHIHDDACGYKETVAGTDCTHEHDDTCGYEEKTEVTSPCTHSCELCQPADEETDPPAPNSALLDARAAEWTVIGWKDSYAVGDEVELTFSYPGATKYYVGGRTPAGLTIHNSKESTNTYYMPLADGTLKVTGTLERDSVTEGSAFNVTAYNESSAIGDPQNQSFVITLLPTPEWTVTGWQDSYAVGDTVNLTISYPDAPEYRFETLLPDGLACTNEKRGGYYLAPDNKIYISGTLTEAAVSEGHDFRLAAQFADYSEFLKTLIFVVTPAPSPKRTTTLDLTTISTSNTMGATHSGGVYTNNVEKWVYDTTKNPAVLTLKGVDIETNDLFGIKLPTKDGGVTVDVVVEEGTVNNVQTTKTETNVGLGEVATALGCDHASTGASGSIHIKGSGTLNLSTSGNYGIALGTHNGELSISEATVTAKASGSTAAYALYAKTSITVNSGTVYATASGFASFVGDKAYTIADTLEVKGSDTYDVTENLTAAAPNNDYYIKLGADGSGAVAKTIKIQPLTLDEIILGTTPGYTNDDAGLRKAMADILENGVIKLGGDLTMTAKTEITSGKFVLDLGSYTFTGGGSSFAPEIFVNGGELTVRATTGGITGRNAVSAIGVAEGKLTIEGGTFTGGPADGAATPGDGLVAYAVNPNIVLKGGTFAGGTGEGLRYAYSESLAGLIAPGYKAQWTDTGVDLTAEELASNDGYVNSFKIVPLDLADLIAAANAAKAGVTVNAGPASSVTSGTKFVTQAEMDAFVAAIAAAQAVADNQSATGEETAAAAAALTSATDTFKAAIKTGAHIPGGDKTALISAIAEANNAKNGIAVNDNPASSVASGTKFVATGEMKALNDAIAAAQAVADNVDAADAEISAAVTALNSAVAAFKAAIKTGAYIPGGSGGSSSAGGSSAVNTPQTGDGTPLFLLGAAAVLCAGILALLIFLKRRLAAQES